MIAERLSGGDRRQVGASDDVVSLVLRDNAKFGELFDAMLHEDPTVRMRAAEATEKLARVRPDLLAPYRKRLIEEVGEVDQHDVRRRVAQMLANVRLDVKERSKATALLERYLQDTNVTLVVESLQTLVDFAKDDRGLRKRVTPIVERMAARGTPAMQVRARKLLARLETPPPRAERRRP
ncbi:MAG: hypothetical protein JO322_09230 [Candidatus Eremiobacteraeota bacterium]|nr:hypothetical protein [Candidatus Eremiobacteraeota bacterium]